MQINSYSQIKDMLDRFHLAPNKKFGQNFLLDRNVLEKIAAFSPDRVLEIGPGLGGLTHFLCRQAQRVVAVEIDAGMVQVLGETQGEHQNLTLLHGDFLNPAIQTQAQELLGKGYGVVANLPYYITTPILLKLIEQRVPQMVLMMQKEVARRLGAAPGTKDYGSLSIAVQFYYEVEHLFDVHPGSFFPRPAVDSAVIRMVRRQTPAARVKNEALFFRVVRASFAMRRKTLLNNLSGGFGRDKEQLQTLLCELGIDPKRRGETLTMEEFARLTDGILPFSG